VHWQPIARDYRHLAVIAKRVLSQPVATSECEDNWSDLGFVQAHRQQPSPDGAFQAQPAHLGEHHQAGVGGTRP